MRLLRAIFVWCIWFGMFELSFGAKVRHYKFDVEYMYKTPDCLEHVVMGINGQFPGPTIRAEVGDTLVIDVTNKLHTEGTVIHWHGIRQVNFLSLVLVVLVMEHITSLIIINITFYNCTKKKTLNFIVCC